MENQWPALSYEKGKDPRGKAGNTLQVGFARDLVTATGARLPSPTLFILAGTLQS